MMRVLLVAVVVVFNQSLEQKNKTTVSSAYVLSPFEHHNFESVHVPSVTPCPLKPS